MNAIVVTDENWGIGKDGKLLTRLPGDMKFFRETTKGNIVVMGRKTLESFPDGKPLKNRVNVVLTSDNSYAPEGVAVCKSIKEALEYLKAVPSESVFIIGGQSIYQQFLPYCETAYVTHIFRKFEADTYFTDLDKDSFWTLDQISEMQEYEGLNYEFRTYRRKAAD